MGANRTLDLRTSRLLYSAQVTLNNADTQVDFTALAGFPATGGLRVMVEFGATTSFRLKFGQGAAPAAITNATAASAADGTLHRGVAGETAEFIFAPNDSGIGVTHMTGWAGSAQSITVNVFDK